MSEKKLPVADAWNTVQCECPYCSHIQDTDEESGGEDYCEKCGKHFIVGDHN